MLMERHSLTCGCTRREGCLLGPLFRIVRPRLTFRAAVLATKFASIGSSFFRGHALKLFA